MNPITSPIRWTIHDLEALPENEGIRRELINGELFVTRAPHWEHQKIIVTISAKLYEWSQQTKLGEVSISPGIVFSEEDSIIPDLVWISNQRLGQIKADSGHLTGFPELVVEVLSAGERNIYRDREAKLQLYSKGVQEYWIVDRFNQQLEVYRQHEGQLVLKETLISTDDLKSPLLPKFSLSVQESVQEIFT